MSEFSKRNYDRTNNNIAIQQNTFSDLNALPVGQAGIVRVPDSDFIYQYVMKNQNITKWGISFSQVETPRLNIQYQIWANHTLASNGTDFFGREMLSLMRGIDEAI
ncbi:hypothetical protein HK096_000936, partial [Nowakowskiella sp. JEL0078]